MKNLAIVSTLRLSTNDTFTNIACAKSISQLSVCFRRERLIQVLKFEFRIDPTQSDIQFELRFKIHGNKKAYEQAGERRYMDDFYALHEIAAGVLNRHQAKFPYSSEDYDNPEQVIKGAIPSDTRVPDTPLIARICKELVVCLGISNPEFWESAKLNTYTYVRENAGDEWVAAIDYFRNKTPFIVSV